MRRLKVFCDSADPVEMDRWRSRVDGFTLNPLLMVQAGQKRVRRLVEHAGGKPISVQILKPGVAHATEIASWGTNVAVKVPLYMYGERLLLDYISDLINEGIPVNVTGLFSAAQVDLVLTACGTPRYLSIFAGRLADALHDPRKTVRECSDLVHPEDCEVVWASAREVGNLLDAQNAGADIITMSPALLDKGAHMFAADPKFLAKKTGIEFFDAAAGLAL